MREGARPDLWQQSLLIVLAAEQRQLIAWGQVCSSRRANRSPRFANTAPTRPPRRFGGVADKSPRGSVFLAVDSWGYTSLAVAGWFTPG